MASAGLTATAGAPLTAEAATALRDLGVPDRPHRSRRLTPRMLSRATVVYCMTTAQRDAVQALHPPASARVLCLDDTRDIPDPHGRPAAYRETAAQVRSLVVRRLTELATPAPSVPAENLA